MSVMRSIWCCSVFFFNDTATTEIYTLSLHDALPISGGVGEQPVVADRAAHGLLARPGPHHPDRDSGRLQRRGQEGHLDRKSTRLNSSHANISYAVFCLKKKKKNHDSKEPRQNDTRRK